MGKRNQRFFRGVLCVFTIVAFFLFSSNVQAQNCGCNHVVEVNTTVLDGKQMGIKPGDVVCLKAGKRTNLLIKNFVGSSSNYITIKNCGGQVVLGGSTINNGILVQNSRYFRITGTGDSSLKYGIKIDKTKAGSQGVAVAEFSSDVEIDHLEIIGAGFAGIMAKTDPKCDGSADRGKFTMYNVKIHDNYIHDLTGEGIYIGNSFYNGTSVYCNRTQYPHEIKGVRVYNNIIKNTGWEGIQVGSATHDTEIYDNEIYNYGQANKDSQNNGIQLGLGTTGKCYNNYIENGYGTGIVIQGIGNNLVYNNVIVGAGYPAFNVNVRPTPLSSDVVSRGFLGGIYIINNTIIDTKNKGAINEYINDAPNNVFYNNLIVSGNTNFSQLKTHTSWKLEKNVLLKDASSAKFVNPSAKDYRLQQGSPAVDAGRDISSFGISQDWDRKSRKAGSSTDAGISEYAGSTTTPTTVTNAAPKVNAGSDQSIQLPTNSATFTGSASDTDGSIASYSWTKVSGPSANMSGTSTNKLQVSNLVAGSYTFRLTVKDDKGASTSDDAILTVKEASTPTAETPTSAETTTATAPSNLVAQAVSSTQINLSWKDNTTNEEKIIVERSLSSSFTSFASIYLPANATKYEDKNKKENVTFYYRIRAVVGGKKTGSSNIASATTSATTNNPVTTTPTTTTGNKLPQVNAGSDKTLTLPKNSVSLYFSGKDEDGVFRGFKWEKVSGPAATLSGANTANLLVTNMVEGVYTFRITVTDNDGGQGSDEVKVTVVKSSNSTSTATPQEPAPTEQPTSNSGNLPPLVKASNDKTLTLPENKTLLTCAGKDEDGFITSYLWTKINGPAASMSGQNTANLNLSNLLEGSYTFRVTVTDNYGTKSYDDVIVKVVKATTTSSNIAPTATTPANQTLTLPTNSITLNGSGSDKDGSIASYQWAKVSGPSASLSGTSSSTLKVSGMVEGTYTFRLTVKDNAGATGVDDVTVTVKKATTTTPSAPTSYSPIYRINAGGNAVSGSPIQWDTDTKEIPSRYLSTSSSNNVAGASSWNRTNKTQAPNAVFANMRFDFTWGGAMQYNLPVKSGSYEVRLYFAETPYAGGVTAAGQRVFDIKMEGQTKVSSLDIYKEVGMNALQKTVIIQVTDGTLNIDFVRKVGNPQVNGIEILPVSSSSTEMRVSSNNELNAFDVVPEQSLSVFPNPVDDQVNVRFGQEVEDNASVELLGMDGRTLMSENIANAKGTTEASFDISRLNMAPGIYLLKVQVDGKEAEVVKILKN